MKNGFRTVAFTGVFCLANFATALAVESVSVLESRAKKTKVAENGFTIVAAIDSGIASYQDIQLPQSTTPGFRADGRRVGIENAEHFGIPVRGWFQIEYGTYSRNAFAEINLMQIASLVGPSEVSDSQYDRVETSLGGKWGLTLGNTARLSLVGMVGYRRDRFQNISAGHYISAILPKGGLTLAPSARWNLSLLGGVGVNPIFGYSDGEQAQDLDSSVTQMAHFEATVKYRLNASASISLGGELESVQVQIADTSSYSQLGLTVAEEIEPTRQYQLSTSVAFFRLEKRF